MTVPVGGFLLPWEGVDAQSGVAGVFARQVAPGHILEHAKLRTIARRVDTDDVLFEVMSDPPTYAVVHLTWGESREQNPEFPWTTLYASLHEFREAMVRDNQEYES